MFLLFLSFSGSVYLSSVLGFRVWGFRFGDSVGLYVGVLNSRVGHHKVPEA